MAIALPNLDDRRWSDLVEEGRTVVPFYSREWTDHNFHDPGITLVELFAALAEMDIYRLNRITDRHLRKFLALIGIHQEPPLESLTVLKLSLKHSNSNPLPIPATTEFEGRDPFDQVTNFRSLSAVSVVAAELAAIQRRDAGGFHDLTKQWQRGEAIEIFGSNPTLEDELYFGFTQSFPVGVVTSLLFVTNGFFEDKTTRRELKSAREARAERCRQLNSLPSCERNGIKLTSLMPWLQETGSLNHHSVRLGWEFLAAPDDWRALNAQSKADGVEVVDETRAFTLNGSVLFTLPATMAVQELGHVKSPLYYIRCRISSGAFDFVPKPRYVGLNAVLGEQAKVAGTLRWKIKPGAVIEGTAPQPGSQTRFVFELTPQGEISKLSFVESTDVPEFSLLEYIASSDTKPGLLSIEAAWLGMGNGKPNQRLTLPEAPALDGLYLFTFEAGSWRRWSMPDDFTVSTRGDSHVVLDLMQGTAIFGDGENGRVVPENAPVIVRYTSTRAENGNLPEHRITKLADNSHNRAILAGRFDETQKGLATIDNPVAATGGAASETLTHAIGRAIDLVGTSDRAVTLADYESLAARTPGVRLARVSARANLHPAFPCLEALGLITVIVLPYLPADRPVASQGLRRAVMEHLASRRVIGTRVEVVSASYVELIVKATIQSQPGTNKAEIEQRIVAQLNKFFHPLVGGPDGTGWPFGRDVFRAEVLQTIDGIPGVDHVISMEFLTSHCGKPQCGNICLQPTELIAAGAHQIEVE